MLSYGSNIQVDNRSSGLRSISCLGCSIGYALVPYLSLVEGYAYAYQFRIGLNPIPCKNHFFSFIGFWINMIHISSY